MIMAPACIATEMPSAQRLVLFCYLGIYVGLVTSLCRSFVWCDYMGLTAMQPVRTNSGLLDAVRFLEYFLRAYYLCARPWASHSGERQDIAS